MSSFIQCENYCLKYDSLQVKVMFSKSIKKINKTIRSRLCRQNGLCQNCIFLYCTSGLLILMHTLASFIDCLLYNNASYFTSSSFICRVSSARRYMSTSTRLHVFLSPLILCSGELYFLQVNPCDLFCLLKKSVCSLLMCSL